MPKYIYLASNNENSVKIDILTPQREKPQSTMPIRRAPPRRMTVDDRQIMNMRKVEKNINEIGTINNEIDNLINYKSDLIIGLLKEYINDRISSAEFSKKMKANCDITCNDLYSLTRSLIKKHHFQVNKDYIEFSKIKFLNFPTTATDLG
jgi:hypothetical protein